MRWLQAEYILKGIYLGLLLYVAGQKPDGWDAALLALFLAGGLVLALGVAGVRKLREGYRVRGRVFSYLLFLLLENPVHVYLGILAGLLAYAYRSAAADDWLVVAAAGGGLALGLVLWLLRHVRDRRIRLGASTALFIALPVLAAWLLPDFLTAPERFLFGVLLLVGVPFFYLLTLAGMAEESELEIGALCALLGLGLWMVLEPSGPQYQATAITGPLLLYLVYTWKVLPGLRVFKHVIRALSYSRLGQYRPALARLRRALQLDPRNTLAREVLWGVHREMDLDQVALDPETLALVNFDLCLERVSALLLREKPQPPHLQEAHRLLDMVSAQRPDMQPACDYWRAVAYTHSREYDQATTALEAVVTPTPQGAVNPYRRGVLMAAWQLALTLHKEMNRRVGTPQLALPGRRMEAIAAVERHLAATPDDPEAWNLKRVLYSDLTEAEYEATAGPDQPAADFDHGYAQQLGLALINDPARWRRGGEYLRIAARGIPTLGVSLFLQIAKAHDRAGDPDGVWHNYRQIKRVGRTVGPKNLPEEDRHNYFAALKLLGEEAEQQGQLEEAIEDYLLYREYERSGKETYRKLAELYEKNKDAWAALHATEQGLVHDARDKDLLQKKDRCYYSVMPEELKERWESVYKYFDVAYCLEKAQALLKVYNGNLDLLDWAQHLASLAQAARPDSQSARVVRARVQLLRGEKDEAQALLEDVHTNKPAKFATSEDEDAWYTSCKLLGNMYLHELHRPDLAVQCFLDFRKSSKSGADTMYRLGQAYEELGDLGRAIKCYNQVVSFESHPLAPDAHEALQRLKSREAPR
jgi:tetratricopeptide (TPR) repeat protein